MLGLLVGIYKKIVFLTHIASSSLDYVFISLYWFGAHMVCGTFS